jgi:hypothetical protein
MKKIQEILPAVAIVLFAVLLRLLPHVPNIAPIAAMGIFGGMYLNKKYALVIPLVALFVSDIFLGFYKGMPFVYGSFLLTGLIGLWLQNHKSVGKVIAGTVLSSLLFFVITNFGVWLQSGMYAHTWVDFVRCYTLALPFLRNTLFGDMLFVGLFVGSYELMSSVLISENLGYGLQNKRIKTKSQK